MADKDIAELMRLVGSWEGWRVENTQKTYKVFPPNGHKPFSVAHGPRNPWRSYRNVVAKLRRAGADI